MPRLKKVGSVRKNTVANNAAYYSNSKKKLSKTVPQRNNRQDRIKELLGQKPEEESTLDVSGLERVYKELCDKPENNYCMIPENMLLQADNPEIPNARRVLIDSMICASTVLK